MFLFYIHAYNSYSTVNHLLIRPKENKKILFCNPFCWVECLTCVCACVTKSTVVSVSVKGVTAGSVHRENTAVHCSPWMGTGRGRLSSHIFTLGGDFFLKVQLWQLNCLWIHNLCFPSNLDISRDLKANFQDLMRLMLLFNFSFLAQTFSALQISMSFNRLSA